MAAGTEDFYRAYPGTSKMKNMEENIRAVEVTFTEEEMKEVNETLNQITIIGERYDPESDNGQRVRK